VLGIGQDAWAVEQNAPNAGISGNNEANSAPAPAPTSTMDFTPAQSYATAIAVCSSLRISAKPRLKASLSSG